MNGDFYLVATAAFISLTLAVDAYFAIAAAVAGIVAVNCVLVELGR